MTDTIVAAIITAVLAFVGALLSYRYQSNKDRKFEIVQSETDKAQLAKIKIDVEENLWVRVSRELENLQRELDEEREKRRLLERRVDVLEDEKSKLSIERDFLSRQNMKLQNQVNELQLLVESLTKDNTDG